ncbi:O-acetyl-ADP-ribose deacetylase (regulator of RNase III), contains Macro domain [Thalassospira xiamenensis]|uniref:O-acetyl-ADP-ribose deacetylase (Regulator of RNase III), contains Macro domain n=2 Tax=Thalassospira xiamenensis TaxID=220697 RepID=A0A285T721_9PROT|nr:O-acetyl-ADP-ribose deacetylase (regulator of RNase III), contains Macro domain [Thalassospira xiamenensis]
MSMSSDKRSYRTPSATIHIVEADITGLKVDAIVNAANEALLPGGGVCGAIHRAAGPELARACKPLAPCPTGQARLTPAFNLPVQYVIHTVGPFWHGGDQGEAELLASCYRNSVLLARQNGLRSIAFPAISTGIFGYPEDLAANITVSTLRDLIAAETALPQIYLCCFSASSHDFLQSALTSIRNVSGI